MTDILYISGSGRCGSTLLERLVHASGEVFAAGELHALWRVPAERITCSCGRKLRDCATWQAILRSSGLAPGIAELARLEALVSRTGFLGRRGFAPERILADAQVTRFLDTQRALFDGITRTTGKNIVLDSSKAGPRAFLLSCRGAKFIHLRRDPGDVIASWRSRKFDGGLGEDMRRLSPARAAGDWMKSEFFARRIAAREAVAFVDYAAFCAAPRATVDRIAGDLGLRLDGIAWSGSARFEPGPDYHSLNGNPDRFWDGPIAIAHRAPDRAALSVPDRLAASALGALASLAFPLR